MSHTSSNTTSAGARAGSWLRDATAPAAREETPDERTSSVSPIATVGRRHEAASTNTSASKPASNERDVSRAATATSSRFIDVAMACTPATSRCSSSGSLGLQVGQPKLPHTRVRNSLHERRVFAEHRDAQHKHRRQVDRCPPEPAYSGPVRSIYRSTQGRDAVQRWCARRFESWGADHRSERFVAADAETHLVLAGAGSTTVLVISGDRFCAAANLRFVSTLASRCRVAAVDVPGQPGLSAPDVGARDSLAWYGDWLSAVVDVVRDRLAPSARCLVLGQSFGATIALACRSTRLDGRVLVSPGGLCTLRLTPGVLWDFSRWMLAPSPTSSERVLRRLSAPGRVVPSDLVEWMSLVGRHARPVSVEAIVDAPTSLPTIVLTGASDVFLSPERVEGPARRLGAAFDAIDDAGHLLLDERPEVVAARTMTL